MSTGNLDFDVVTGLAAQFITVSSRMKTGVQKGILDEIGSRVELRVAPHISLANFSGEFLHIGAELFA